jgi:hypothetical protein
MSALGMEPQQARSYEYLRVQVSTGEIVKTDHIVDELGREGWMLSETVSTDTFLHMWFVRPGRSAGSNRPLCVRL